MLILNFNRYFKVFIKKVCISVLPITDCLEITYFYLIIYWCRSILHNLIGYNVYLIAYFAFPLLLLRLSNSLSFIILCVFVNSLFISFNQFYILFFSIISEDFNRFCILYFVLYILQRLEVGPFILGSFVIQIFQFVQSKTFFY